MFGKNTALQKKLQVFLISSNNEFDPLITIEWKACATKICYEYVWKRWLSKTLSKARPQDVALQLLLYKSSNTFINNVLFEKQNNIENHHQGT